MAFGEMLGRVRTIFGRDASSPDAPAAPNRRAVEIGWIIDAEKAGFVWSAPRRVRRDRPAKPHAKSLTQCPALLDHEARLFEVACPIDLRLGFNYAPDGRPALRNLDGDQSSMRNRTLDQMIRIVDRREWAHPDRPVLQFITPYLFLSDEPVWLNQFGPFHHYRSEPWPGTVVGGRLPIDVWPRHLMWAFEWWDISKPLVLNRGEPWWCAKFETVDPSRPIRMVEAVMTPELRQYVRGLSGVTGYVNQTFRLFEVARERRPEKLLVPARSRAAKDAASGAGAPPAQGGHDG